MISNAPSGIKALSLSDQFGPSAGSLYTESAMDALKDQVVVQPQISPLQSMFDGMLGRNATPDNGAPKAAEPQGQNQNALQQELKATLSSGKAWKPTEHLNNNRVATNTTQNRQEGNAKMADAGQKMAALKADVQDITRRMGPGSANGAGPVAPQSSSMLGSLASGFARDAAIAGGLTAMGLPFAAAAYSAASMAVAITGRGTFGVASSGEFSKPSTDRKGRIVDAAYTRSEPATPAAQPAAPAAPQSSALWNKLSNGPGFGAKPTENKVDAESADLTGQSLTGITALKLAENSPAMMAYKSQRLDGEAVHKIHEARIAKGIVADDANLIRAQELAVPDAMLTKRAMLPGMHV